MPRLVNQFTMVCFALITAMPAEAAQPVAQKKPRPFIGIIPDYAVAVKGVKLKGVTKGGPAEIVGLKAGDIIVKLGDEKIGSLSDFVGAFRSLKVGVMVGVVVKRAGKAMSFVVVPIARKK